MSDGNDNGDADSDDSDAEGTITPDAVCPGCGAETAEQMRENPPIYTCRVCSTEFNPNGEEVDIE